MPPAVAEVTDVVTRDGDVPLLSHACPGNKPGVTQFPDMIAALAARHGALAAAAGQDGTEMTVVFDAGQNSEANFALLAGTNLHDAGSVPASDCSDLLAVPASGRDLVDEDRFGQLTAYDTRRAVSSSSTATPPKLGHRRQRPRKPLSTRRNTLARSMITGNSG